MEKINIAKIFASFAGCFFVAAISVFNQPQILPDVSPSLGAINNLFSLHLSEPAILILSGIGLIGIASVAREGLKK